MTILLIGMWLLVVMVDAQLCPIDWFGDDCTQNATACAAERCNGHGVCTSAIEGCECDIFYHNTSACNVNQTECRSVYCHDRGECTLEPEVCNCDSPFFADAQCSACVTGFDWSSNCTRCASGYYGLQCQWNQTECSVYQCNGHGFCGSNDTECICASAWNASADCSASRCTPAESRPTADGTACECLLPYYGPPDACTLVCSYPRGYTQLQWNGTCRCGLGWTGPDCAQRWHQPYLWSFIPATILVLVVSTWWCV